MNQKNPNPFSPGSAVVAYLRDSGGDNQDLSLPQQISQIERWCQDNGYRLSRIFQDEAKPGSSEVGRESFLAMLRHFRSGGAREAGVIVWKFNRLARDFDDAQFHKADLRRRGFAIHSLNDPIPAGLDGRFFEAALDWMSARFLEDLSSDVRRGLAHLVSEFGAVPGRPPVGFKRQPVQLGQRRDGRAHVAHRWIPDADLVPRVVMAWEMRAAGATYRRIQEATGLYTSKNSWSAFFANRIYIGILDFGGLEIKDYCIPIVDRTIWDAVQERRHKSGQARREASGFLLSGLARCGRCGSTLNGHVIAPRRGNRREYYVCSRRKRRGDCRAPSIPRAALETALFAHLQREITGGLDQVQAEMGRLLLQRRAALEGRYHERERQERGLHGQIANLTAAIAANGHSPALLAKLGDLEGQQRELQGQRLPEAWLVGQDPNLDGLGERLARLVNQADPEKIRSLYRSFFKSVTVERKKNEIKIVVEIFDGASASWDDCQHAADSEI